MLQPPSPHTTITPGIPMPVVGLGTWDARGREAYDAVRSALEIGYRHVDTATAYANERAVGRAVRESGLPREEIFVTTKLPPERAGRERETIEASLEALGLAFVDLWLVHWPPRGAARPDTWEALLAARADGLARSVGVSNYSLAQIDELVRATGEAPAVNQIRWGPTLHDPAVVAGHRERGVVLEGWSPFKSTNLRDPVLVAVAARHGITTAQVIVRWHLEHGVVVIPKSSDPGRIRQNLDVFGFELSGDDLRSIDGLGRARR